MLNFEYYNPTRIVFGVDTIPQIDRLVPKDARVLVAFGGNSAKSNGTIAAVLKALGKRYVVEFAGIEANPEYGTLMRAADLIKAENLDFILAVGGGSVIDGVKFIAAAAKYKGEDPYDICTKGAPVQAAVPYGAVLTLPATSSEMNAGSVVSRRELKLKRSFVNEKVFPQFSILDPKLTLSLPEKQTVNGIVDTFVHIVEQYVTKDYGAVVTDALAEGLLRVLVDLAPKVLADPNNLELRGQLMWTCTNGLNGLLRLGNVGDWSTHMIGHELTALYGIDHARTLAVVLPGVWEEKFTAKRTKLARLAKNVYQVAGDDEETLALAAIAKTIEFFHSLKVGTRFSDYGLSQDNVKEIVANLQRNNFNALGEDKDIDYAAAERILNSRV